MAVTGFSFLKETTWISGIGKRVVQEARARAARGKAGKNND
jgi:hypothetical protein